MKSLLSIGKRYILPSSNQKMFIKSDAEVTDIISVILKADQRSKEFTARFAPFLRGSSPEQTLKNVWSFVRKYIRYEKDRSGDERIKSPGKTWEDKYGDCKSMSVMVGSLLKNLGFRYFYRVAFYDKDNPEQGHIYPVAILPGGEMIVVDAVHYVFDEEVEFWRASDYDPETGKKIAGKATAISGPALGFSWGAFGILVGATALAYYSQKKKSDVYESKLHTRCD